VGILALQRGEDVKGAEWTSQLETTSESGPITTQNDCDFTWEYEFGTDGSPPNWVCEAVAYLGGVVLTVYPEPTTSAAGIATIAITTASGGCTVAYTIEDETEINLGATVGVCLNSSCSIDGFGVDCNFDWQAYLEP
jgi:FtsH-binding integral membrane protein